ncbi:hypothetical protein B0H19DRAFT_1375768 [Mycena capillaripes]|nr:hypothetical protein B0H19DRAFT_1375768 [Mycena capillaripes]
MAHDAPSTETSFSSLADWSRRHITDVFDASTTDLTVQALDRAFSRSLKATVNGEPVDFDGFSNLIASIQLTAPAVPKSNGSLRKKHRTTQAIGCNGVVKGEYYIRGTFGKMPGTETVVEIETCKKVVGRIESQSSEAGVDSRRIVKLDAIVSVEPVDRSKTS